MKLILIVDDDPEARDLAKMVLTRDEWEIEEGLLE